MSKTINPIVFRAYIKGVLTANAPFVISVDDDYFDLAPLKDSNGEPFIPGSSIAGVLLDLFDGEDKELFFGYAKGVASRQSQLITYDCFLRSDSAISYSVRDGIKLKADCKSAQQGAKVNYEMVEPGCCFDFKMEVLIRNHDDRKLCFGYMQAVIEQLTDVIYLGAKRSRGLGKFTLSNVEIYTISGDNAYRQYVDFSWEHSNFVAYKESDFLSDQTISLKGKGHSRSLRVTCKDTLLIRSYDDPFGADSRMVTSGNLPVIPGSSWNGLFRHHARRILDELDCRITDKLIEEVFGADITEEKNKKRASNIVFSDSTIEVVKSFLQTNVKIDRFTQGAADGALFNSRPIANFITMLHIHVRKPEPWICDLIHLVICDINSGFIALGGQTSVGRGILQIEIEQRLDYTSLSEKMINCFGEGEQHA